MFSDWMLRVRALFERAAVERDIDDELQFHIDHQVESYVARGLERQEAIRRARLEFGGVDQVKEEYRDALGVRILDDLWRDLRLAVRSLRATPMVSAIAGLSLALGIGANIAIFSLIDSLILRTLPVKDASRLVLLTNTMPGVRAWGFPVWDQVHQQQLFEDSAAWSLSRFNLATGGETQFVDGLWASGSFFETLGVPAMMGRTFSDVDDQSAGGPDGAVAVISYSFWRRHFGGAADVIGRTLALDGVPFTVIGVTPPAFFGMEVGRRFDVAAPLGNNHGPRGAAVSWLTIVARLKPPQTLDAATASLRSLQSQIRDTTLPANAAAPFRKTYLQAPFVLVPAATGSSELRRQYQQPLLTIMVVVALVMLIACANIANLLLARATARRREFSVRLALGATRWRLARQVVAESVVLAATGTAVGMLIAAWGSRALVRQLATQTGTQSTTVFLDLSLHWHLLAFTSGATVVTVLLFGVAPAFRASGVQPMGALKEGRGMKGDSRAGLASGLVVAQLALSLVLVVAAGLFVRTFASLVTIPLGFEADHVLVATVGAQQAAINPAQRIPLFERALDAVRTLPNVTDAAASLTTPISGLGLQNQIDVSGATLLADNERGTLVNHVSPGWFRTYGTAVLAGRDFTNADGPSHPSVAIVNEAFARKFLNGASPLGHTITGLPVPGLAIPIVGVVRDAVYRSLRDPAPPIVYLPFVQSREVTAFASMSLSVRSSGRSPALLTRSVTAALNGVNPQLTWTLRPLTDQIDASVTQERVTAMLSGFFGVLALVLAGLGLYGITSYAVTLRRTEIGIRVALGAHPARIMRLVLGRSLGLTTLGILVGLVVAITVTRFIKTLLFGLTPLDPPTFIAVSGVFAAVAILAAFVPARRATRVDPLVALRME